LSAVDDARILSRLERLASQADLSGVSLAAPTTRDAERLGEAIRRLLGDEVEVRIRVREGPAILLSVEIERS
jgi:hypothetical protein